MIQLSVFHGKEAHQSKFVSSVIDIEFISDLSEAITNTMWSPGVFEDNIRSIKNFKTTQLLVLDIDEGCTIEEAKSIFNEYKYIIGTSRSHLKEKNGVVCERFRVVLFLDKEITSDSLYKEVWNRAKQMCPAIDSACKDSSRFFFPCTEIVSIGEGQLFPVGANKKEQQIQPVTTSAQPNTLNESKTKKGILSKRALKFWTSGAPNGKWHEERNNFIRECKQNNYSKEECLQMFQMHHEPDSTDLFQLDDVWQRGVKHGARLPEDDRTIKNIMQSKLIRDLNDPMHSALVDLTKGIEYDIHERRIRELLGKDMYNEFVFTSKIDAHFKYDPTNMGALYIDDNGFNVYNCYQPPAWLRNAFFFNESLERVDELPEIYEKFFLHLTDNNIESFEYLVDWLANSLQSRNLTLLTAIGEQGVGKGVLGTIMQKLHGEKNFNKVRDQVFKAQFNSALKNKTLVYVDEIDLKTKESQDRIKDTVNDEMEIEEKGKDSRVYKNYASFYLSSNTMDAIKIEGSDRRFSILQLTSTKFTTTPLIHEVGLLTSDENIAQLARFLRFKTITNDMTRPLRSERYEEVRESTLKDWEIYIIEDWVPLHKGKNVLLTDLKNDIDRSGLAKFPPGRPALMALARKYPELFNIGRVGNTKESNSVWWVKVK